MYFYTKINKVFILTNFLFITNTKKLLVTFYLVINSLFVLKYSSKLAILPNYIAVIIYIGFVILFFYLINLLKNYFNTFKKFNLTFLLVSLFFSLVLIFINLKIDGNTLNVDRWSAMEVLIESVLNREYPYSILDHLGNTPSNLPSLFYKNL